MDEADVNQVQQVDNGVASNLDNDQAPTDATITTIKLAADEHNATTPITADEASSSVDEQHFYIIHK